MTVQAVITWLKRLLGGADAAHEAGKQMPVRVAQPADPAALAAAIAEGKRLAAETLSQARAEIAEMREHAQQEEESRLETLAELGRRIEDREERLTARQSALEAREQALKAAQAEMHEFEQQLEPLRAQRVVALQERAGVGRDEAAVEVLSAIEQE